MIVAIGAALLATGVVAYHVGRAWAEGVPTSSPLYFSGTITEGATPVEGTRDVIVRFWDRDTGGTNVCTTTAAGAVVRTGRFRIALDAACTTAVQATPDLWVEVQIGTTPLPGRMKVGAVPYALESGRAVAAGGTLAAELADLRGRVAALESAPRRPCPTGMVAAGSFCIDKYEASVWSNAACDRTGTQYGETTTDDYPGSFPDNGNFNVPLYACSIPGVMPARMITWFQAQQACAASGKHLCTNEEWQTAVAGTYDPGSWPGAAGACGSTSPSPGRCNTCSTGPRSTGQAGAVPGGANDCISMHGAEDMIGNLWEWTAYWATEPGWNGTISTWNAVGSASYGSDAYFHGGPEPSPAHRSPGSYQVWDGAAAARLPGAAIRGGTWADGPGAGAFAVNLEYGPSSWTTSFGFRCCLGR